MRAPLRQMVGLLAAAVAGTSACAVADVDLGHDVGADASTAPSGLDGGFTSSDVGAPSVSTAINASAGTICSGQCVELVAAVTGNSGPYSYAWEPNLGEGAGPKTVCPAATSTYSVMVESSDVEGPLSSASVTIAVRDCDAGAPSGTVQPDAGLPPGAPAGTLCVSNPSFEPAASSGASPPVPAVVPPDWQVCSGSPNVDPSVTLVPASNGSTYVGLFEGSAGNVNVAASIGTTLCAPLQQGTRYSFCVDLGVGVADVTPGSPSPVLQIRGGQSPCGEQQLLWTSPPITSVNSWTTDCGSFVASSALSTLTLVPSQGASSTVSPAYVIVDDIVARP